MNENLTRKYFNLKVYFGIFAQKTYVQHKTTTFMSQKEKEKKEITPSQYFDYLKGAKNTITTDELKNSYSVFLTLGEKYKKLGQKESLKKLCFLADTLKKEEKLIELGINTYVYKDVIEDYIEHVADKTVKIIELSRYMREIPDELVDTIEKTRELFDELYVVFTDYTGKEERKVEKERRDKDPILFGVFKNNGNVADRFYFIGDWVDEYCDLTLDKMIEEFNKKGKASPVITVDIPKTSDELLDILKSYKQANTTNDDEKFFVLNDSIDNVSEPLEVQKFVRSNEKTKKGFFSNIRSVFKRK